MISTLRGTVIVATAGSVVIELGGFGLTVSVTPAHALSLRVGSEAFLHTALIVRDDELSLFGFTSREELEVFELLRGVSGVGPKSALGVLATLSPDEIARAVVADDDAPFRKVSGIGPKTAKLITVSLAGKLAPPAPSSGRPPASSTATDSQVITALVGLGWAERVASQAVADVVANASAEERGNVPVLLRLALTRLGPQRVGSNA